MSSNNTASFTLVELMLALVLVSAAMVVAFSVFFSISKAWQRGTALADNVNHGEFFMEQLSEGLRSAFYPPPQGGNRKFKPSNYGFTLEDNGNDADAHDVMCWVKTGTALMNADDPVARGPHRISLSIENDPDGTLQMVTRAWRPYGTLDDFDPADLAPFYIPARVTGLNCRVSTNRTDEGWEWIDTWDEDGVTNHLPLAVEITLYQKALSPNDPPMETKRVIEIPVGPLSWYTKISDTASTNSAMNPANPGGGMQPGPGGPGRPGGPGGPGMPSFPGTPSSPGGFPSPGKTPGGTTPFPRSPMTPR